MQPVGISAPLGRAVRRTQCAIVIAVYQILNDCARFRYRNIAIHDNRSLAQRMYFLEFGRCQAGLFVAPVAFDLVFDSEFLEQPQDALRAGVFEVVDR